MKRKAIKRRGAGGEWMGWERGMGEGDGEWV
jgi:hypothetical protein